MNQPQYDYSKMLALLVEDEVYTRQVIRQMLFQVGIRSFVEATDGKGGLMEVARTRPDIVFLDVHMGEFGGLFFLEGLRKIKLANLDKTPVVMLTADASTDTVMFAKQRAIVGYLVKPVSPLQLKQRLDAAIAANPELAQRVKPTPA